MALPSRKILCPIDFDDNAVAALDTAAVLARQNDGTIFVLHVVPLINLPIGMAVYVDKQQQLERAELNLQRLARKHLTGVKYELLCQGGEITATILRAVKSTGADLMVMATHGRRGFSHFMLGSIAEEVLREASCPVLTVRATESQRYLVGAWATTNPITATPDEKLSSVQAKMLEGGFRCVPIVKNEVPVGIITDRDILTHIGVLDRTEAFKAMSEDLITVSASTTIKEAARLLRERKIDALPMVEDGKLLGVITTTDILNALTATD
jgi:nucleotide-binding universal stress UspA family protein/CBS domain-containing protein